MPPVARCAVLAAGLALLPAAPPVTAATATAPASVPATQAVGQQELDALLAPVALFPDALLAQVLMASTYPLDVVSAERWVRANPGLKGKALEDALAQQTWDPSVRSLVVVPQVLTKMSEKLDWTQKLGAAFVAQPKEVMTTVQALRARAVAAGTLKTTAEQSVQSQTTGGTTVIQIVPAQPQVVYVPVYHPTTAYGTWWWSYPPYVIYPPPPRPAPGLVFATGVVVGAALWGQPDWRYGRIDIDINHYNSFNRTTINTGQWQHDPARRDVVPYAAKPAAPKPQPKAAPAALDKQPAPAPAPVPATANRVEPGLRDGGRGPGRDGPGPLSPR